MLLLGCSDPPTLPTAMITHRWRYTLSCFVYQILHADFAKLKEERLNSPPSLEDDGMKSPLASTASSDPMTPQFVINVTNTVSGVDTVMQKAMEEAREDHRSAVRVA